VVVTNRAGDVLLIRRSDNDNWAVPGGAIDLGESLVQAAVRETRDETGIDGEVTGLVGIYTDPRHVIVYTSNGEARQEFSIVLTARATGGELARSEESSEVRWVPRKDLGGYSMDRSMRLRKAALPRGTGHAPPRLSSGRSGAGGVTQSFAVSAGRHSRRTAVAGPARQ